VLAQAGLVDQRLKQAAVRPAALALLRRYFDAALTTAAITLPDTSRPVARVTHR
jgi:hypothetical protein